MFFCIEIVDLRVRFPVCSALFAILRLRSYRAMFLDLGGGTLAQEKCDAFTLINGAPLSRISYARSREQYFITNSEQRAGRREQVSFLLVARARHTTHFPDDANRAPLAAFSTNFSARTVPPRMTLLSRPRRVSPVFNSVGLQRMRQLYLAFSPAGGPGASSNRAPRKFISQPNTFN